MKILFILINTIFTKGISYIHNNKTQYMMLNPTKCLYTVELLTQ